MFIRLHLNQQLGTVACTCYPSYTQKTNRRIVVPVSLGIEQDSISKPTQKKGAGRVDQAVEHLPRNHEALSLTPSTTKKKIFLGTKPTRTDRKVMIKIAM
jgi:hypothetical protein